MASIIDICSDTLFKILNEHFSVTAIDLERFRVIPTTNAKYGDYQFNGAMPLGKQLGKQPRELAGRILELIEGEAWLEKAEVAGPGFVNLWISHKWLAEFIQKVSHDERLGVDRPGEGRSVVIDYSSPNVAKPMHIGHIRSTMLGAALDRMYRFLGYQVIADNHIGDWGTQFGILLVGYRRFADLDHFKESPIEELERVYVECAGKAKEDPQLMDEARQELVRLQQGDADNRKLWQGFVEASLKEFEKLYQRLGVSFDVTLGESFYNDRLQNLVDELSEKGIAVRSDGALAVFMEDKDMPPFLIQKSDGGFNYGTTDIATILYRMEKWQPEKIIYVTDERQQLHFRQLFTVAERLGIKAELEHIWFGVMRLPEGTFSTRDGNVIKLERLLDEAEEKAFEVAHRLNPGLDEDLKKEIARKVGLGAVKYADLSQNRQSTVLFTWEKALSLEGNSAPYLQYVYARIQSVFRKYEEEFKGASWRDVPIMLQEDLEIQIAKRILEFPEQLNRAADIYRPNQLTDYLFDLASLYNRFYQNLPFLKAADGVRESRLVLCDLVARIIKTGLGLLGIEVPDRM